MRRLLNRETGPPINAEGFAFRFTHENGHTSKANDYFTWKTMILEHRQRMNLPITSDLMALAEDQLCGQIPPHLCQYDANDAPSVDLRFGFDDVKRWVVSVAKRVFDGQPLVEQAEAERRAAICVACPLNVNVTGGCGGGCEKMVEVLTPGMYARSTKQDSRLRSCGVCHCYLRVLVHFPLTALAEHDKPEMQSKFPTFCWQKIDGPNYKS